MPIQLPITMYTPVGFFENNQKELSLQGIYFGIIPAMEVEYKNAARNGGLLALILIDIDHFKHFNDTYGHQVGDEVLQNVAQTLRSLATRPRDMVFRYGGEEFAVVLNNTNLAGTITVAEKMRRGVETSQLRVDNQSFSITISAGISVYNPKTVESIIHSTEELIRQADAQLYLAKADGRNRVAPIAATT